MEIKVVAWDPQQRIVTIDINGNVPQTQADVPPEVQTQDDWTTFLEGVVRPVIDSMIQAKIYDPNLLIQLGDLSSLILTADELAALQKLFPPKP